MVWWTQIPQVISGPSIMVVKTEPLGPIRIASTRKARISYYASSCGIV
jgi:hypothetical protein